MRRGQARPLAEGAPLAISLGTRYPILQGPMTRVSDVASFAEAVAREGALPFLALALLRGPEARALLSEISHTLAKRPWGVGILGFVPPELREEQFERSARRRGRRLPSSPAAAPTRPGPSSATESPPSCTLPRPGC